MAKRKDQRPSGRFARSGHISYGPRETSAPPSSPPPDALDAPDEPYDVEPYDVEPYDVEDRSPYPAAPPPHRPTREYGAPPYDERADAYTEQIPDPDRVEFRRDDFDRRPEQRPGYSAPTYHRAPPTTPAPVPPMSAPLMPPTDQTARIGRPDTGRVAGADPYTDPSTDPALADTVAGPRPGAASAPTVSGAALNLGKATLSGTGRAARTVTQKVITASKSDGAEESGLTSLIWNQVLSYGTDAMVTVALAGTVFFGASADAQRGNVLLYLLVTMAPFAVVAPIIGPALDRLQHGRRWTMAGTAIGRAVLALIMAMHPTELLVLYPCALGSLVLSKAYGVVRAAAAPRLVPRGMTLTEANAKLTIFGLGSTIVAGGLVGAIIKVTGSYTAGLLVTAFAFAACGFFAFGLPKQVDSAVTAPRHPEEPPRPARQPKVPPLQRLQGWASKGFDPHLVVALQGESVLRLLSGMLTIYLAFYVESTSHGLAGVIALGGVVGAAGAGNFAGTAIGTRLKMARPETTIIISTAIAAAVCVLAAITFSVLIACVAMLLSGTVNALSKIALDSLIQKDVVETLRSSAFARSETFLQLAWVLGAALAIALPSNDTGDGAIAFVVAAVITGSVAVLVFLRNRANGRPRRPQFASDAAGNVVQRSLD